MIVIREASSADAARAWAIRTAAILAGCKGHYPHGIIRAWAYGDVPRTFAERLAAEGCIAEIDDQMAGFGVLKLATEKVDGMFVHPDYMRLGIGRRLLQRLETMAMAHGLKMLSLDASLNGASFYHACGYVGDKVSVYHSPRGIDLACIPMNKSLRAES